jgi:hypothetical protein
MRWEGKFVVNYEEFDENSIKFNNNNNKITDLK